MQHIKQTQVDYKFLHLRQDVILHPRLLYHQLLLLLLKQHTHPLQFNSHLEAILQHHLYVKYRK